MVQVKSRELNVVHTYGTGTKVQVLSIGNERGRILWYRYKPLAQVLRVVQVLSTGTKCGTKLGGKTLQTYGGGCVC